MNAYNHVTLAGNLTRDPELTYTPKGTAVCKCTLALNHSWTTEAGEKREEVSFIDLVIWGRTAENVAQYMKKGRPMLADGRLKQETWDDKQTGQKKSRVVVIVNTVLFLGTPDKGEGEQRQPQGQPSGRTMPSRQQRASAAAADSGAQDGPPDSDDVPF